MLGSCSGPCFQWSGGTRFQFSGPTPEFYIDQTTRGGVRGVDRQICKQDYFWDLSQRWTWIGGLVIKRVAHKDELRFELVTFLTYITGSMSTSTD